MSRPSSAATTSEAGPTAVEPIIPTLEQRLDMYRIMVECRGFEQRAHELFLEGLVRGTSHLALGHEAIAAGVAAAQRPDDYTFCTYRGHHHTLARGTPMGPVFAELFGRQGGLNGAKGGSMHLTTLAQGDAQRPELAKQVVEDPHPCHFGTLSLWQGLDVPGDTCQLVICLLYTSDAADEL